MTTRTAREPYLETHQSHPEPITPYERKLAGSLSEVYAGGVDTLDGVVEGLNNLGLHGPDGGPWTAESFRAEMRRLGK
ncbi:recombinase-like helix-turn-helix domain-containing protein [Nocardia sp. 348MFTsu5.1]|uniref:recombinase-like helix-turn-helix domain-containing protein n=1 Tax=Nocardia sp. 348MFTsu5.1 TaxID=1172185 RepID=UPI00035F0DC4|nr:recombinase-like helix-turn-helix domain-containing protein [Nocardia sp. 348MFTsu5.1]